MKALLLVLSFILPASAQVAQLSGGETQRPATTGPTVVTMEQVDLIQGLSLVNDNCVRVHHPGKYLVVAAPQCGRLKGGDKENIRCWLRVNGVDVPNSNVLLVLGQGDKDVIVSQGILQLAVADKVQVIIAVSDPKDGVGIEAIDIDGEPLVPSIIFSMYRIGS